MVRNGGVRATSVPGRREGARSEPAWQQAFVAEVLGLSKALLSDPKKYGSQKAESLLSEAFTLFTLERPQEEG